MERERDAVPIWARPEPGGRRPRFTRAAIAAAAVAIADAEGFEAVTMRRVAAELGAGTMSLYHYVRGRDDLLDLMDDAVMAEVVVPDEALAHGWREALRAIAASSYQAFLRHPWMLQVTRGNGGPSTLRHFEQSLHAASLTGLDERGQIEAMSTVDDYVFGFILRSRFSDQHEHEAAFAAIADAVAGLVEQGDYPRVRALVRGDDPLAAWRRIAAVMHGEGRFERGLERVLDGIAAEIARSAG